MSGASDAAWPCLWSEPDSTGAASPSPAGDGPGLAEPVSLPFTTDPVARRLGTVGRLAAAAQQAVSGVEAALKQGPRSAARQPARRRRTEGDPDHPPPLAADGPAAARPRRRDWTATRLNDYRATTTNTAPPPATCSTSAARSPVRPAAITATLDWPATPGSPGPSPCSSTRSTPPRMPDDPRPISYQLASPPTRI